MYQQNRLPNHITAVIEGRTVCLSTAEAGSNDRGRPTENAQPSPMKKVVALAVAALGSKAIVAFAGGSEISSK